MTEYKEVQLDVRCPKCDSEAIPTSGWVIDTYPPIEPFECSKCAHEFHSCSYALVPKSAPTDTTQSTGDQ